MGGSIENQQKKHIGFPTKDRGVLQMPSGCNVALELQTLENLGTHHIAKLCGYAWS